VAAARSSRGLGLIRMEQRVKLLKGTLSIETQLQRGTTINACVPLGSGSGAASAGQSSPGNPAILPE
jgi:signal transduction histidine kinase